MPNEAIFISHKHPHSGPEITIDLLEDGRTDTDSVVVFYYEDTGDSLFDRYLFSIDDQRSTTVVKEKYDKRLVTFDSLVSGTLYTVTARTESGEVRSRGISTQVLTGETELLCHACTPADTCTDASTHSVVLFSLYILHNVI